MGGDVNATAAYTALGQISQLTWDNLTETRSYNSLNAAHPHHSWLRHG